MNSFIFVGFAIIGVTSAARTFTARGSEDQDIFDSEDKDLVDVTKDMIKMESSGTKAIRCCCDTVTAAIADAFDKNERSGRCQIFTAEKAFKCRTLTNPAWLKHTGNLKHFTRTKDPRCLVPGEEAEQFYQTYGTADNYCKSFKIDGTTVKAAALGKDSTVACDAGYTTQSDHVTCVWKSVQEGIFDPQPECVRDEEWCATVDIPQVLSVAATELGGSSPVTCAPGFEPVHAESTCTTDRSFKPIPECKPISNYCEFEPYPMGPSVQSAIINEWVPMTCPLGFTPSSEMTQCTKGGTFEPQPHCTKVLDFCKEITTKPEAGKVLSPGPSVASAALGDSETVRCNKGYDAKPAEVKCTESGNFDPTPKCIKNWAWYHKNMVME